MKTLFITDLDGTLLRRDQLVSDFSASIINDLIQKDNVITYATARSFATASKVTAKIDCPYPAAFYNGSFIQKANNGELLASQFIQQSICNDIFDILEQNRVNPIVYAMRDGREKFSYVPSKLSISAKDFVRSRFTDLRNNPVPTQERLYYGEVFHFNCIDVYDNLKNVYEELKEFDSLNVIFYEDIYTSEYWLEIMPKGVDKASAAIKLKELCGCDKIVCFGDSFNDLDLFDIADESYAVSNACEDLKEAATGIIGSNEEDGVANWLRANVL